MNPKVFVKTTAPLVVRGSLMTLRGNSRIRCDHAGVDRFPDKVA